MTTTPCRVNIVDDIRHCSTTVNSPRDRSAVIFDLMKLARRVNRRRSEAIKVSLSLTADSIVLHWHSPCREDDGFVKSILELARPMYEVEQLIQDGVKI
jgi:hypothetical protein